MGLYNTTSGGGGGGVGDSITPLWGVVVWGFISHFGVGGWVGLYITTSGGWGSITPLRGVGLYNTTSGGGGGVLYHHEEMAKYVQYNMLIVALANKYYAASGML